MDLLNKIFTAEDAEDAGENKKQRFMSRHALVAVISYAKKLHYSASFASSAVR